MIDKLHRTQDVCWCLSVQIAKIREDVDYYIASCCESDFEENEELYEELHLDEASAALGSRLAAMNHDNDDHSSDVSSEAPSIQNSTESVSPSPSIAAHSKVVYQLVDLFVRMTYNCLTAFCPRLPGWAGTRKVKSNLDFTDARDSEWQRHQLGHMQVCTWLQAGNDASTPPVKFFTGRIPVLPPNQRCESTDGKLFVKMGDS